MAFSFRDVINRLTGTNHSAPKQTPPSYGPTTAYQYGPSGNQLYNVGGDPISGGGGTFNGQSYNLAGDFTGPAPAQTGGGGGTGGTGGVSTPDTSGLQNDVRSRISNIQNVYDQLTGNIDKIVNERAQQYGQNYDQQLNNLNQGYQTNAGQQAGAYQARGLGDSSFYGNAQQDAGNIYNQNLNAIGQDRNNTLGQLGQYAQSSKAQYGAGKNAYNDILGQLPNFDATQLQGLNTQLGTQLGNVNAQAAGIGTNADFLGALNQITPTQNQGTSQLASKLQSLVTSGAPQFAKSQIAQGLIKQAQLTDPGAQAYWNDYYNKLLNGQ